VILYKDCSKNAPSVKRGPLGVSLVLLKDYIEKSLKKFLSKTTRHRYIFKLEIKTQKTGGKNKPQGIEP